MQQSGVQKYNMKATCLQWYLMIFHFNVWRNTRQTSVKVGDRNTYRQNKKPIKIFQKCSISFTSLWQLWEERMKLPQAAAHSAQNARKEIIGKILLRSFFTTEHLVSEQTGLFQPGEAKASGGPSSSPPVPMGKLAKCCSGLCARVSYSDTCTSSTQCQPRPL